MSPTFVARRFAHFLPFVIASALTSACGSDDASPDTPSPIDAGPDTPDPNDGGTEVTLHPGEQCEEPQPTFVHVRFEPGVSYLQPGQTRTIRVAVDPDMCDPATLSFESSDASKVEAPAPVTFNLRSPRLDIAIRAPDSATPGPVVLTARLPLSDGTEAVTELPIHVLDDSLPVCSGNVSG